MRSAVFWFGLLASASACGFSGKASPLGDDDDPPTDGQGPDGPPGVCTSFSRQVDTCMLAFGDVDLRLMPLVPGTEITYDTQTHQFQNALPLPPRRMTLKTRLVDVDALLVRNFILPQDVVLRAIGPMPFAIIASGRVTLETGARIEVSDGGAGAIAQCSTEPVPGENESGGGGGGGGGGLGAAGGNGGGGNLDGDQTEQSAGGAGATSTGPFAGPRGGCAGARGGRGTSDPTDVGGMGGRGGGAIFIAAGDRIELGPNAVLNAGGGGGKGGGKPEDGGEGGGGGGGGGSGGIIFLESPRVGAASAWLSANGGGGGEGGDSNSVGRDGSSGRWETTQTPAGGNQAAAGGDGGQGGSVSRQVGQPAADRLNGGGGGGGGGVGYIHVITSDPEIGNASPARSPAGS